jgi:hypothetical protein
MFIDCKHERRHLVWSQVRNWDAEPMRVRQLRYQCQDCGLQVDGAQRHALASPDTPDVDIELLKRGFKRWERECAERARQYEVQREAESEGWWRRYNEYLGTSAWRDRRELVLRRANGICEGCLEAKATQVHHTTYAHVGNEFLWELRAICDECHDRFHEEIGSP